MGEDMDGYRKYQIFISSSYRDLKEERKALIDRILIAGHIPAGMESFVAGDEEDLRVIKRAIDQCDVYVVLIGSRYGSIATETPPQSFTQVEYRYARDEARKPILAFLLNEEEFEQERNDVPGDDAERKYEGAIRELRQEVKMTREGDRQRIVGFFGRKTLNGIGGLCVNFTSALDNLVRSPGFEAHGWVPAELYESTRLPVDVDKNPFIRGIVGKLSEYDTLSRRVTQESPDLKAGMADYFWDRYLAKLMHLGYWRLFFESGSTIAYLSAAFANRLLTPYGHRYRDQWKIRTNNILTYLQFVLWHNISVDLYPYGPPEKKYGATFGRITNLVTCPPPGPDDVLTLTKEESTTVRYMASRLLPESEPSLFLITASALELDTSSPFEGPHVGSYYNRLFKRAVLANARHHPVVMFLDEGKVPNPFKVGHCHPVCDRDLPWSEARAAVPLALLVGASSAERRDEIVALLKPLGLDPLDPITPDPYGACFPLVAANASFHKLFG
jgi:hypothetical protein